MQNYFKRGIAALAIVVSGCAHTQNAPPTSSAKIQITGDLKLFQLKSNPVFVQDTNGNFESVEQAAQTIRVFRHKFANQQELQSYLLERRMILHKSFQDQIAPYFGLVQLNKACLENVDTKGEIQQSGKSEEFMKMSFPALNNKTISDCANDNLWGIIEYHFHNCKKTNELFELRISNPLGKSRASLRPQCL